MKEAGNALLEELIGTDAGAIAKEIDKRVEYVLRTQNPKNAGSTEYQKLGEYVLIRMFYKLPMQLPIGKREWKPKRQSTSHSDQKILCMRQKMEPGCDRCQKF